MNNRIAVFCFFLSGFAGLVYEIAWIRKATLAFGSTIWALSTVLAVFFGGLALGSWLFGRLGQRMTRPIRVYGFLELALAALALVTLLTFPLAERLFGTAYRAGVHPVTDAEGLTWLGAGPVLILVRVLLVALVIFLPTVAMGGTLPLFCRQFVRRSDGITGGVGFLYGINTLGAALGTAAAGFFLIPTIGVVLSITLAAFLNLVAGAAVLLLRFDTVPVVEDVGQEPSRAPQGQPEAGGFLQRVFPVLFFLTGLVAVGAEVFWSRFLALIVRNSVTTYTITLTVVLSGIVLGSLLVAWLRGGGGRHRVSAGSLFGLFQILSALFMLVLLFQPTEFWKSLGRGLAPFFLLMLPMAVLSGASFPLAIRMVLDDPRLTAARVGRMTAFNTAGGIVGSLLAGFVLLPILGLETGVKALVLLGLLTGSVAWVLTRSIPGGVFRGVPRLAALVIILALVAWAVLPGLMGTRLPVDHLAGSGKLIDYAEGLGTTLAAVDMDGTVQLQIDNLWQGTDIKGHQIMAAHLPAILHGDPGAVLVIGVGVGQTAGRFLHHGISTLDCVDIEREVFPFIQRNFDSGWMTDPRVTLVPDDGRTFTAHTDRRYDIISIEVGQVFRPGVDVFYNREFYRNALDRLEPGGLVAQFVPLGFLDRELFRSVVGTFLETFPEAVLWFNTQELLLIGSPDRMPHLDLNRLEAIDKAATDPGADPRNRFLAEDLTYSHWDGERFQLRNPGVLLGGFLAGPAELAAIAEGAAIFTDDLPTLAYATSGIHVADHPEDEAVEFLAEFLAPLPRVVEGGEVSKVMLELADRTRQLNLRDVRASGLVTEATLGQAGRPVAETGQLLLRALEWNPESYLANYNTGKLLLMNRQSDRALPYLEKAGAMRPSSGLARRDLGLAYIHANRPAEALANLEMAVEILPRDAAALNYLGTALAISGRLKEAVAVFEKALTLAPQDQGIISNLNRARGSLRAAGQR